ETPQVVQEWSRTPIRLSVYLRLPWTLPMPTRATLRVPSRQVPALEAIRELSEADFDKLATALRTGQSGDTVGLRNDVVSAVPSLDESADGIIDMLLSATALRNQ